MGEDSALGGHELYLQSIFECENKYQAGKKPRVQSTLFLLLTFPPEKLEE